MKALALRVAAAAALVLGTSAYAAEGAGAKLDKSLQKAAQKLHASNQGEVQAGQAALRSAQSEQVKQFAQQMIDDHQKNDSQLQQLASSMSVSLEGSEFEKKQKKAQEDLEKVQGKTGAEFDSAYMKMMVKEHEQDVKDVEKAAKDARKQKQTQLASFLEETHSHLRMHLDNARTVEKSLGGAGMAGSSSGSRDTAASGTSGSGSGSSAATGDSPTGTTTDSSGRAATTGGTSGGETGTDTGASGDTKDTGTSATTGSGSSGTTGSSSTSGSSDTAGSSTSGSGSAGSSPATGDSPPGTTTESSGRSATTGGTSGGETGTDTGASGDTKDTGTSGTTGSGSTSGSGTR